MRGAKASRLADNAETLVLAFVADITIGWLEDVITSSNEALILWGALRQAGLVLRLMVLHIRAI